MEEKAEGRRMRVALWPRTRRRKSYRQKPSSKEEEEGVGVAPRRPPREERGVRPPRPRRTRPRPTPRLGPMRRGKGRRGNGARWAEEECYYRTEKRGLFITQKHEHTEAQTM